MPTNKNILPWPTRPVMPAPMPLQPVAREPRPEAQQRARLAMPLPNDQEQSFLVAPAYAPQFTVLNTEEMLRRTEIAAAGDALEKALNAFLIELLTSEPSRRADGLTYDDVLELVRKEWPQLREGPMRSVASQKFYNSAITDDEIWECLECFYGAWWEKNPGKAKMKLAARLFR